LPVPSEDSGSTAVSDANKPDNRPGPMGPKDLAGFAVNVRPLTETPNAELALAYQEGLGFMKQSEWDKAIAAFNRGFGCAETAEQASLLCLVGICHVGAERMEKAAGTFFRSLTLAQRVKDDRSAIAATANNGFLLMLGRLHKQARETLTFALQEARRFGFLEGEAKVLVGLAALYRNEGKTERAQRLSEEAVEVAQRDPDRAVFNRLLFGPAYDNMELDLEMGERLLSRPGTGVEVDERKLAGLVMKANALRCMGRYAQAEPLFELALTRARQLGLEEVELGTLSMLVDVLQKQQRREEAIPLLERMYQLARRRKDAKEPRLVAAVLGREFLTAGDMQRALPLLLESFWSAFDADDKEGVGVPLRGLVEIYREMGADAFHAAVVEHGVNPERADRLLRIAVLGDEKLEGDEGEPDG